jgi:hypothetical protein
VKVFVAMNSSSETSLERKAVHPNRVKRQQALNDVLDKSSLKFINKNSINTFVIAIGRIRRPETDSHTFRTGLMKLIPTQIQSIYYFLLEKLQYLQSIQPHLSVLFHMQ